MILLVGSSSILMVPKFMDSVIWVVVMFVVGSIIYSIFVFLLIV